MSNENVLENIHQRIGELKALGGGAAVRRAQDIVAEAANELSGKREIHYECRREADLVEPLTFSQFFSEISSEHRRRSIAIDPEESLAAELTNLYAGRTLYLEVRSPSNVRQCIDRAEAIAAGILEETVLPIRIAVNRRSAQEIVRNLRALAHAIENGAHLAHQFRTPLMLGPLPVRRCKMMYTDAGATRWAQNGRAIEQQLVNFWLCEAEDGCCPNQTWSYTTDGGWVVIWRDGDATKPPPEGQIPPDFDYYPWNNACAVFPSPINATVVSDFGFRNIGGTTPDFHPGIDIKVSDGMHQPGLPGASVIAVVGGTVNIKREDSEKPQNIGVYVTSGQDVRMYWHINPRPGLANGSTVRAGEVIGTIAPNVDEQNHKAHLHFAQYRPPNGDYTQKADSNAVDPCVGRLSARNADS